MKVERERGEAWKRSMVAQAVLQRAAAALDDASMAPELPAETVLADPEDARRGLIASLALLRDIGARRQARGGFWRDLMRAAEALDLLGERETLEVEYRAALARVPDR